MPDWLPLVYSTEHESLPGKFLEIRHFVYKKLEVMNVSTCAMLEINSSLHSMHKASRRYKCFVRLCELDDMICTICLTISTKCFFKNKIVLTGSWYSILRWSNISDTVPRIIYIPCSTERSRYYPPCLFCPISVHHLVR